MAYTTRSITLKKQNIAQRLGFTNEMREVHQLTDNPSIVVIVEQSTTESTHVIVMSLTDSNYFHDKYWLGFPESLTNANITIDDDGISQFLVINGPRYAIYYTIFTSDTVA